MFTSTPLTIQWLAACWHGNCSVACPVFPRESRLSSKDTDQAIEMACECLIMYLGALKNAFFFFSFVIDKGRTQGSAPV